MDLILNNPFSLEEFKISPVGVAASQAIAEHADQIIRAANAGAPPIGALASNLNHLIDEGLHWRMVERMISEWLGPQYETSGRKPVPMRIHRRGRCYVRKLSHEAQDRA